MESLRQALTEDVCRMLVNVLDSRDKPTISNQGQAMDGFSELANYRAIAEKAKLLIDN